MDISSKTPIDSEDKRMIGKRTQKGKRDQEWQQNVLLGEQGEFTDDWHWTEMNACHLTSMHN